MNNNYIIRRETPDDFFVVENLVRESFWNVYRPGCAEHYVLHCFRNSAEFVPQLDYVLQTADGEVVGQVMFARASVNLDNGGTLPVVTFGPICILPRLQRKGLGKFLLDYALDQAEKLGFGAVCTEGNIDFYGTCGFVLGKNVGIRYADDPEADYFIVRELKQGYLDGVSGTYTDPKEYFVDDADVEEFDKLFPPKQKEVRKGQLQ